MLILGLTGSIGMGKSTTADVFRQNGIQVLDADQVVHALYEGKAVGEIAEAFPGTSVKGKIDRQKLSAALAQDPSGFQKLEAIVHPLVWAAQSEFLHQQKDQGAEMAVLEIPLLFETGGEGRVDVVIVVSASRDVQEQRVLERPGMTKEKLAQLLARQVPDEEKRKRADFVVDTDVKPHESAAQITDILQQVTDRKGEAFERFWR